MTAPTTPDRLAQIEQRLAAATPGPWEAYGSTVAAMTGPGDCGGCSGLISPEHEPACYWSEVAGAAPVDATLIAHAPEDLAALLAFARRVEEILDDHVSTDGQIFDDLDRAMKRLRDGAA